MPEIQRRRAVTVDIRGVRVGSDSPVVVQSMTNTDTADIETTLKQTLELAEAGSEIVRWTVNVPEAAAAVPEIKKRMLAAGCHVPIIEADGTPRLYPDGSPVIRTMLFPKSNARMTDIWHVIGL